MTSQKVIQQAKDLLAEVNAIDIDSLSPEDRSNVQESLLGALQHAETPYEHLLRLSGSVGRYPTEFQDDF
jgi:hypothetical protein